jgi:hypothetical protein
MGAFNFDFRIARRGMDVGFLPTTISSDLQQANVTGPTHSLVHVMSMFLALGMSLPDVITATTSAAAARIGQADRHGALRVGRAADITLLDLTDRDVVFADTVGGRLPGDRVLEVVLTVKDGVVVTPQPEAAAAEENWSNYMALQEDAPPEAARTYDQVRRNLLGDVAARLEAVGEWALLPVQTAVGEVLAASELGRGEAGRAVLGAFLDPVFPQAPGFFLALQERSFVLDRLRALARG